MSVTANAADGRVLGRLTTDACARNCLPARP
jgi:hypothetical protein